MSAPTAPAPPPQPVGAPHPVSVTGGADGLAAHLDELDTLAGRFGAVATDCLGAAFSLHGYLADGAVLSSAVLDPGGWSAFETALLSALDGPHGVTWIGARCGVLDLDLRAAVRAYRVADTLDGALHDQVGGLLHLPAAIVTGGSAIVHGEGVGASVQAGLAADPGLADVAVDGLGLPVLLPSVNQVLPDGHGVAVPTGRDTAGVAGTPPRRLTDLVGDLAQRNADPRDGSIDVRILTLPDGSRRVVVDITGTKTFTPLPTSDITSLETNARALVGAPTAYEQGVLAAMRRAGVRPDDDVMLVGHSEGGMVAVTTARDAVRSGRFHVTHVITAGSPVGRTVGELPASVQVLALENRRDVVPHLDGVANPDRPNVTTVTSTRGDRTVSGDHAVATAYAGVALDAQASDDPSVRAFLAGAGDYFRATSVRTQTFQIVRQY